MFGRNARLATLAMSMWVAVPALQAIAAPPPVSVDPISPPATQPAKRDVQSIVRDIQAAGAVMNQFNPADLLDAEKRKEIAGRTLPSLKKLSSLADELGVLDDPQAKEQGQMMKGQLTSMQIIMGDKDVTEQLEKKTKSTNATEALAAKSDLLPAHWLLANKDDAAQTKLLVEATDLAKANPTDDRLTVALMTMTQMGASSHATSAKIEDIILGMKSQAAAQMGPMIQETRKLHGLEDKPLVIKGAKNGGGEFSTEGWKGKVVLVDFWATWCGPCLKELPRVKKAYTTWHEKGLEILGVSCDNAGDDLTKFLAENPDMPWPQLFDPKTAGWHPIATGFGITGIPTMFLIDKKGVVRSVDARENFEELIPKMLEEK